MSFIRFKMWRDELIRKGRVRRWKKLTYKTFPWYDRSFFFEINSYWLLDASKKYKKKGMSTNSESVAKEMLIAGEICKRLADDFIDENTRYDIYKIVEENENKKSDDWKRKYDTVPKYIWKKSGKDNVRDQKAYIEMLFDQLKNSKSWWD